MLLARRPITTGPYLSRREAADLFSLDEEGADSMSARAPAATGPDGVALALDFTGVADSVVERLADKEEEEMGDAITPVEEETGTVVGVELVIEVVELAVEVESVLFSGNTS